jgi:unsaturated chondroitin disaccharide hydrolase
MKIDYELHPGYLTSKMDRFWSLSGEKIRLIEQSYDSSKGSPVFTVEGTYTTRGWTEWTQGFQYGSALLQFDATGDRYFLDYGREHTRKHMALHVSHGGSTRSWIQQHQHLWQPASPDEGIADPV